MMRLRWGQAPTGPEPVPPPGSSLARWQWGLRLLVFALPFVAIAAARGAAPTLVVVLVAGAAGAAAVVPDSPAGLAVVVLLGGLWAVEAGGAVTAWTLVAAWSIGAFHVVTAYAAFLPIGAGWDGTSARRWTRRLAVVLGATTAMWAMAWGVTRAEAPGNVAFGVGLAAALAVGVALTWRGAR